jgi:hypothetical protein
MCDLCIGGLHIPYSALLPIIIFVFQWVSTQLSKFFGLKSHDVAVFPDDTKAQMLLQNRGGETKICTELWCLCRKLTRRRRNESIESSTPRLVHEPMSRSESSDSEKSSDTEKSYHSKARRTKKSITTSSFIPPTGSWEFCMPCA